MSSKISREVVELLREKEYEILTNFCAQEKRYWKALRSYVYEPDEELYHPAAEAIAVYWYKQWQAGNEEAVREYIRVLLWSLNDESGGIGWNAPQIIAEIIALIPEIMMPYASMVVDRTMEESLLVPAGLWAIGRLGKPMQSIVRFFDQLVLATFGSSEPGTLGLSAWALGEAGFAPAITSIELLQDRGEPVRIYVNGRFETKPVKQWAWEAILKMY